METLIVAPILDMASFLEGTGYAAIDLAGSFISIPVY